MDHWPVLLCFAAYGALPRPERLGRIYRRAASKWDCRSCLMGFDFGGISPAHSHDQEFLQHELSNMHNDHHLQAGLLARPHAGSF